jgi:hypothetical protein
VAEQRAALFQQRLEQRTARLEAEEASIVNAVPLCVRLQSLLAEGRRHERCQAQSRFHDDSDPQSKTLREKRLKYIDNGYRNLITDVKRRGQVIAAHNPPMTQQHALGTEAIGCFSSMLPWSDGIVTEEPQAPHVPNTNNTGMMKRPAPFMKMRAPAMINAQTPACSPKHDVPFRSSTPDATLSVRWTVPQRLATDSRKLAQITAARRKRLQSITPASPRGFTLASCDQPCVRRSGSVPTAVAA